MRVNLNQLCRQVAFLEKGNKEVDIAQIKEVVSKTLTVLRLGYTEAEILEVVKRSK